VERSEAFSALPHRGGRTAFALISEATGHRLGNVLPALHGARAAGFTDVTGDNGAYPAAPGWDAATGLGVPSGHGLSAALKSSLG
jgi:kumamolisin